LKEGTCYSRFGRRELVVKRCLVHLSKQNVFKVFLFWVLREGAKGKSNKEENLFNLFLMGVFFCMFLLVFFFLILLLF
jgi:hypothetical protein